MTKRAAQMSQRDIHLHTEAVLRAEVIKRGVSPVLQRWADNFAARAEALNPAPVQGDLFARAAA